MTNAKYKIIYFHVILMLIRLQYSLSQPVSQIVTGKVFDLVSEIPLPGATVYISKGTESFGSISDENGIYRFDNIPVGRYNIEVRYIGYEPHLIPEILVSSSKVLYLDIGLKESQTEIQEVKVRAQARKDVPLNQLAAISARTFTVEETRRYAGGFDDPGRMASSFAGVAGGSPNDNALSIRGNAPKYVLWRIEGVEVHNPNHFATMLVEGGGVVSLLSAQILSNSDFYTGAFPAEYGNALSGVFDMNLRTGNNKSREWGFQVGTLGIDFFGEGPFIKGKSASYLFNYRHATTALMKDFIPEGQLPIYKDLSFKLNFPTKKAGIFSIWATSGLDDNGSEAIEDTSKWETKGDGIKYTWQGKTILGGIKHKYIINPKTWISNSLSTSQYKFSDKQEFFINDDYLLYEYIENYTSKNNFTNTITHKFNKKHMNKSGIIFSYNTYKIDIQNASEPGELVLQYMDQDGGTGYNQFFTQNKWEINNNISLIYGFHSLWFWLNNSKTLEPRLGLKFKFLQTNTLSLAYGNHSQIEPLITYFAEISSISGEIIKPNKQLKPSRSNHFIIGYDKLIGDQLRFKTEVYYQHLYNIPSKPNHYYSLINFKKEYYINDSLENTGKGKNMGIDITLERFLYNNYYFLVTGSIFDSQYESNENKIYNTRWDYDYVANFLFGREFYIGKFKNNILGLNARVVFQGGERIHPVNYNLSLLTEEVVYDFTRLWEDRFPATWFIDLTITYLINKEKHSSTFAIQLKNALKENSIFYYDFNYKKQKVEIAGDAFIFPNISYKIEF